MRLPIVRQSQPDSSSVMMPSALSSPTSNAYASNVGAVSANVTARRTPRCARLGVAFTNVGEDSDRHGPDPLPAYLSCQDASHLKFDRGILGL